jgi:hypothetical protein
MKHKPKVKKQPRRDVNQIAFSVVKSVICKSEGKGELANGQESQNKSQNQP